MTSVVLFLMLFAFFLTNATLESFTKEEIIPDVIDSTPRSVLRITYGIGTKVEVGNVISPTFAKVYPKVEWDAQPDKFYLLAMIDPDAPSREKPLLREYKHWIVANILGADIDKGTVLAEYKPPGPPQNSGFHRYVFLLYEQALGKMDFGKEKKARTKFSIRKLAQTYNLGEPIAGNFFVSQYE